MLRDKLKKCEGFAGWVSLFNQSYPHVVHFNLVPGWSAIDLFFTGPIGLIMWDLSH